MTDTQIKDASSSCIPKSKTILMMTPEDTLDTSVNMFPIIHTILEGIFFKREHECT